MTWWLRKCLQQELGALPIRHWTCFLCFGPIFSAPLDPFESIWWFWTTPFPTISPPSLDCLKSPPWIFEIGFRLKRFWTSRFEIQGGGGPQNSSICFQVTKTSILRVWYPSCFGRMDPLGWIFRYLEVYILHQVAFGNSQICEGLPPRNAKYQQMARCVLKFVTPQNHHFPWWIFLSKTALRSLFFFSLLKLRDLNPQPSKLFCL